MVRLIILVSFIYFDFKADDRYACVLNLGFIITASKFWGIILFLTEGQIVKGSKYRKLTRQLL